MSLFGYRRGEMPVPTYDKFIEPVLRYLQMQRLGSPTRDVYAAAATMLNLSDADRLELLPSGKQPVYKNRAGWAFDRLKRAGLSFSPQRGYWRLTDRGIEYANPHPAPLSAKDVEHLALTFIDVRLRPLVDEQSSPPQIVTSPVGALETPDDRLGEVLSELRRTIAAGLLETLASVSPAFFETVVLDLLHEMGYGANRNDLQRVGGVGDGGIDGVISLDRLGLEKVYIQAK